MTTTPIMHHLGTRDGRETTRYLCRTDELIDVHSASHAPTVAIGPWPMGKNRTNVRVTSGRPYTDSRAMSGWEADIKTSAEAHSNESHPSARLLHLRRVLARTHT